MLAVESTAKSAAVICHADLLSGPQRCCAASAEMPISLHGDPPPRHPRMAPSEDGIGDLLLTTSLCDRHVAKSILRHIDFVTGNRFVASKRCAISSAWSRIACIERGIRAPHKLLAGGHGVNDEVDPLCRGNTDFEQAPGRVAADEHRQVIESKARIEWAWGWIMPSSPTPCFAG